MHIKWYDTLKSGSLSDPSYSLNDENALLKKNAFYVLSEFSFTK